MSDPILEAIRGLNDAIQVAQELTDQLRHMAEEMSAYSKEDEDATILTEEK